MLRNMTADDAVSSADSQDSGTPCTPWELQTIIGDMPNGEGPAVYCDRTPSWQGSVSDTPPQQQLTLTEERIAVTLLDELKREEKSLCDVHQALLVSVSGSPGVRREVVGAGTHSPSHQDAAVHTSVKDQERQQVCDIRSLLSFLERTRTASDSSSSSRIATPLTLPASASHSSPESDRPRSELALDRPEPTLANQRSVHAAPARAASQLDTPPRPAPGQR